MSASERAAANRAARGIVVRAVIPAPTPKPAVDFAALRARRDEALRALVGDVARKWGCDPCDVRMHISPHGCYCACPDGPCEHEFAGWRAFDPEFDDGSGGERVCRLCGMGALTHTLRTAE